MMFKVNKCVMGQLGELACKKRLQRLQQGSTLGTSTLRLRSTELGGQQHPVPAAHRAEYIAAQAAVVSAP